MAELDALERQNRSEIGHWRMAIDALRDLDAVAAPEAWSALEGYLQHEVRRRLGGIVEALAAEARTLERRASAGASIDEVRRSVLHLRGRYLQVETVLDFYGDAINTRTNGTMRDLLRGYDTLAADSMARSLTPLGIDAPPALVYVDKGLGAAILRAGIRLWDQAHPSPVAAIKLTRHNLSFPTAMLHETGHQVGHLTGWNAELGDALFAAVAPRSREVAALWRSWSGEIAADVHAFAQAGWAPVVALANVVDGPTAAVYRLRIGDPHPFPMIRVLFNVAACRSWFGAGPWDRVARAWTTRHPLGRTSRELAAITTLSLDAMSDIVDVCTRRPFQSFGGRPLTAVLDPRQVAPAAIERFEAQTGPSLLQSSYLRRREPLRVFTALVNRTLSDPQHADAHRARLRRWVSDLGADVAPPPRTDPKHPTATAAA